MSRELLVLGTASQAPTRTRNHNGYLLRWDDLGLLFDPGEGTQRQMLLAGARSSMVTHVLITHQHGDHCLGLPGVLQRMALDQRRDPVVLAYPAAAEPYIARLIGLGLFEGGVEIEHVRVPESGTVIDVGKGRTVRAEALDHRVPAVGYRLQEPDGVRLDPAALDAHGLSGPVVGQLVRDGFAAVNGHVVRLDEVSRPHRGQSMAFVMDTRACDGAADLLRDVDLAVAESTFLNGDEGLAEQYGHMTAGQAGKLAADAGARRLVVTHYSQRYPDAQVFARQAAEHHDDVVAAIDLARVPVPRND